jgi:hypothetical protein
MSGDKTVALRAKIVDRIEDRVRGVAGVQAASVRVNDWIQVYWLARCLTGVAQVKDMPSECVESISYHALADLKSKTRAVALPPMSRRMHTTGNRLSELARPFSEKRRDYRKD